MKSWTFYCLLVSRHFSNFRICVAVTVVCRVLNLFVAVFACVFFHLLVSISLFVVIRYYRLLWMRYHITAHNWLHCYLNLTTSSVCMTEVKWVNIMLMLLNSRKVIGQWKWVSFWHLFVSFLFLFFVENYVFSLAIWCFA